MEKKIIFLSFLLFGCAHNSNNLKSSQGFSSLGRSNYSADEKPSAVVAQNVTKSKSSSDKIASIKGVEEKQQDDKDAQLLLNKKMALRGKKFIDTKNLSEDDFYLEILKRYDENLRSEFDELSLQFQQKFPDSSLVDDVLYLQGQFEFTSLQYGAALKTFNLIIQKYPGSNRVPAAYYSKGLTLKQMHLKDLAKEVLAQTQKLFPGSQEARRAEKDLKLL